VKGLIYPLMAIAAVVILAFITAAVATAINDRRKRRAIWHARWEPHVEITGDGLAEISVRLIARWGRHSKTLRCDEKTELVDVEDIIARIEAYTRAETRAENYNALIIANEERE
jgi:hypothetical protein